MRNDIIQLNEKVADEFCRLRIELFEESGKIRKNIIKRFLN